MRNENVSKVNRRMNYLTTMNKYIFKIFLFITLIVLDSRKNVIRDEALNIVLIVVDDLY